MFLALFAGSITAIYDDRPFDTGRLHLWQFVLLTYDSAVWVALWYLIPFLDFFSALSTTSREVLALTKSALVFLISLWPYNATCRVGETYDPSERLASTVEVRT